MYLDLVKLQLELSPLLKQKIHISELRIEQVDIHFGIGNVFSILDTAVNFITSAALVPIKGIASRNISTDAVMPVILLLEQRIEKRSTSPAAFKYT